MNPGRGWPLEPLRVAVVGPQQLERTGIGDLPAVMIDQAQVHEDIAVLLLQHLQPLLQKILVLQLAQIEASEQMADVVQALFEKIVDVLLVLEDQLA
jgi:hypothetical protein